ncbi:MAG: hypothetical protein A2X57_11135 [Nitrospirae bacterium GWD2_57_8]|nr:MAG: hypothetical protein A2X57_11135 [Nitrospirae bacterium GWD2_57_8]
MKSASLSVQGVILEHWLGMKRIYQRRIPPSMKITNELTVQILNLLPAEFQVFLIAVIRAVVNRSALWLKAG